MAIYLKYENEILKQESNDKVDSKDTFIYLIQGLPKNITILGKVTLSNGASLIVQFSESNNDTYVTKLSLTKDIKDYLKDSYFNIITIDGDNVKTSNLIKLNYDLSKITASLTDAKYSELESLSKRLASLESNINHILNGHILDNININNKDYIRKGMMLQAIDDKGNFVALYPFADVVKEINNVKAVNNSINLTADMIQYNQKRTISEEISQIILTIQTLNDSIKTQGDLILAFREELNDVRTVLQKHINDGIV